MTIFGASFFPSSSRRGVRDLNKMLRSFLCGADGVVISPPSLFWNFITTPSARAKDAARHLIDRAATPPRRGGEKSPPAQFSHLTMIKEHHDLTQVGMVR